MRFSFPHSYNSDLLEVLLLLGDADARRDKVIDAGLEILRTKRGSDGMWKMVRGLNGKMHGDLDRNGRPTESFTLDQNRRDLAAKERKFERRSSFTYTVVSPDECHCILGLSSR